MSFPIAFQNLSRILRNPHAVALRPAEAAALLTALGSAGGLAKDGSVYNIHHLPTEMGFSIACPNLPSQNPHPVTVHLAECAALLMALSSMARLVEDVPNLPSRNLHPVAVHSAEDVALLTALGSAVRLAEDDCLLAPGSADDIRLSMKMDY